jgi:oligoribonuclease (3'-5' exoribonuclease)
MQGKYSLEFTKKEVHRALGDVRESIAELQFYLQKADFDVK